MSDRPKPPLTTTTSIWPAAAVLGVAVLMLLIFIGINAVTDQSVTTTTTIPVIVGGLATESTQLLQGCQQPGTPPSNISSGLILPASTRANGAFDLPNSGAGDFDCYRSFITNVSPGALLGYYASELGARGWNLFSKGATNGSPQDLFQKAGSDTFYWVIGITVNTSTASQTDWTFRIYQNSESI